MKVISAAGNRRADGAQRGRRAEQIAQVERLKDRDP